MNKPQLWLNSKSEELGFWDDWFATKSAAYPGDFERRMRKDEPMDKYIIDLARVIENTKKLKILDTGAGPATCLGKTDKEYDVNLRAVDALGDLYSGLYLKYNSTPPIPTEQCDSEELLMIFKIDFFDIVHNRNALDHSYNPIEGIAQMLSVTRKGGAVILLHEENEGVNEGYWGMHQWNFTIKQGNFHIWNREGYDINVNEAFSNSAEIESSIIDMDPARLLRVVFYKKNSGKVNPRLFTVLKASLSKSKFKLKL